MKLLDATLWIDFSRAARASTLRVMLLQRPAQ